MNHYEVLGVARDAPVTEIRRAYLRAVLGESPGSDDDHRRAAAGAWAVLRDAKQRAAYDAGLEAPAGGDDPADRTDAAGPVEAGSREQAEPVEQAGPVDERPGPVEQAEPVEQADATVGAPAHDAPTRRPHPPMPAHVPAVTPDREPALLAPDKPGAPPDHERQGLSAKVMSLFPPVVIGLGIVLAIGAYLFGSAGGLLLGLALMAVGVTSFILIPLFENIVDR